MDSVTLGATDARHRYGIETDCGTELYVFANTRSQAAKIARLAGYTVRSVNMAG